MTHESSGESIASASRIEYILEGQGRSEEHHVSMKKQCAMLTFLDHEELRTHIENGLCSLHERELSGKLPRFCIIYHQQINFLQHSLEVAHRRFHPEIHCIHRDQPRALA